MYKILSAAAATVVLSLAGAPASAMPAGVQSAADRGRAIDRTASGLSSVLVRRRPPPPPADRDTLLLR